MFKCLQYLQSIQYHSSNSQKPYVNLHQSISQIIPQHFSSKFSPWLQTQPGAGLWEEGLAWLAVGLAAGAAVPLSRSTCCTWILGTKNTWKHWEVWKIAILVLGENSGGEVDALCRLFLAKVRVWHPAIPQRAREAKRMLKPGPLFLVDGNDGNANTILKCVGFFQIFDKGPRLVLKFPRLEYRSLSPSGYGVSMHELVPSNLGSLVSLVRSTLTSPSRTSGI